MSIHLAEHARRIYRNRMTAATALQEVGEEAGWDLISQQMETVENLLDLGREHLGCLQLASAPHHVAKIMGGMTLHLGRTVMMNGVETGQIAWTAEKETCKLLVHHLEECMEVEQSLLAGLKVPAVLLFA